MTVVSRVKPLSRSRWLLVAVAAAALAGCGGGDEEAAQVTQPPPPNPPPPPANRAPTISGAPATQVLVGANYTFNPTAADADGDPLTFQITGRPSWATFSATTGSLAGSPAGADVGTSSNIIISVSDGRASAALNAFNITVTAVTSGSATLSWTPPTRNNDGSALTNLAGYRVYWGTSQSNLSSMAQVNNPGLSSYVVSALTPATWYFAVTAVNTLGVESDRSTVASKIVP